VSLTMQRANREPLPEAQPGQYVVLRLPGIGGAPLIRGYSLSGPVSTDRY
jgi:ferredoxin-NADP reductase